VFFKKGYSSLFIVAILSNNALIVLRILAKYKDFIRVFSNKEVKRLLDKNKA
jgi:hypothetical protein